MSAPNAPRLAARHAIAASRIHRFCVDAASFGLTHHRPKNIEIYLEQHLFPEVSFTGRTVLDIGGGSGLCSFYALAKGARSALNIEPHAAGSARASSDAFRAFARTFFPDAAHISDRTIQAFLVNSDGHGPFDIVVLHDSINHLDEDAYARLHRDRRQRGLFVDLLARIRERMTPDGLIVIADCARTNFFNTLGCPSPFAPAIDWNIHQDPDVLSDLLVCADFRVLRVDWLPLIRLGRPGSMLARLGSPVAYVTQSHFVLDATPGRPCACAATPAHAGG